MGNYTIIYMDNDGYEYFDFDSISDAEQYINEDLREVEKEFKAKHKDNYDITEYGNEYGGTTTEIWSYDHHDSYSWTRTYR